jgi:hypothetical protein
LHDQTTECLNTQVTELIIHQRGKARCILEIAHDADGAHAGRCRLPYRIKGIHRAAGKMRGAMNMTINGTF